MASVMEDGREESDPLLAFAWGDVVRTLVVRVPMDDGTEPGLKGKKKEAFENNVLFEEKGKWSLDGTVLGLKWVNDVVSRFFCFFGFVWFRFMVLMANGWGFDAGLFDSI